MEINQDNVDYLRYQRATKRVKAISGFYKHLGVYLIVNGFMLAMRYFRLHTGEEFFTFGNFSMAFFWGIGLVFHAFGVFGPAAMFGPDWEERKIREIMEKEKGKKWE